MAEQRLDLLQLAATLVAQPSTRPAEVMGATLPRLQTWHACFTTLQMTLGLKLSAAIRLALLIARKIGPSVILASFIQDWRAAAIRIGTSTVRT